MRLIRLYAGRACFKISVPLPCSGSALLAFETQKDTPPGSKYIVPAAPVSNWAPEIPSLSSTANRYAALIERCSVILLHLLASHAFWRARKDVPNRFRRVNDGVDDAASGHGIQFAVAQLLLNWGFRSVADSFLISHSAAPAGEARKA